MPQGFFWPPACVLLLSACIGVTGDVSPQGVNQSEVVLAVPLDRPFTFREHETFPVGRGDFLKGQVITVQDGDTINVRLDGRIQKVRLIGIDAPELAQEPWGYLAAQYLRELIKDKVVRLELDVARKDQAGQLLAYVYVGEVFVNAEVVRAGHAVVHTIPPNLAHVEDFQKAQVQAQLAARGVWDVNRPLDVTPDCYRQRQKGGAC